MKTCSRFIYGVAAFTLATVGLSAQGAGEATKDAAKKTGTAVADGAKTAGKATESAAKATGNATADAAKATGKATEKGAEATASGAKKLGVGVKDAVTGEKK